MPRRRTNRKLAQSQSTFDQVQVASRLRNLGERDRRILGYLEGGLCQATIAQRLNVSKPCVNTHVKKLEGAGLIRKIEPKLQSEKGKRQRTLFYELSPDAKAQLTGDNALPITSFHVHHIGVKYKVLRQSAALSKDRRIADDEPKVWHPRGKSEQMGYWFKGKSGLPSVTIYIYSKTWVAWVDRGQMIIAASAEDAERLGDQAIAEAVQLFIDRQRSFGVYLQIDTGKMMGERHYGLLIRKDHPEFQRVLVEGVGVPGHRADLSPDDQLPGTGEIENNYIALTRPIEVVLGMAPQLVKMAGMPDQLNQVAAMVQGGITMNQQYEQMINFMTKALTEMSEMRKELAELRKKASG